MGIDMRTALSNMKSDIVKSLLIVTARNLYGNQDIQLTLGDEQLQSDIVEDIGNALPINPEDIMRTETLEIYKKIIPYAEDRKPPVKKQCIDLLEEVFENEELFELLALLYPTDDIDEFMEDMGCGEKYKELKGDVVYCNRKQYVTILRRYYESAVNLYGVIHIAELAELIEEYEKKNWRKMQFQRENGFYGKTMLFTPKYFSPLFLGLIAENTFKDVPITVDGMLLHWSFQEECLMELTDFMEYSEKRGDVSDQDELLDSFLEQTEDTEYRKLYVEAFEKPHYVPDRDTFLKYADEDYKENTSAAREMKMFLKKNYRIPLQKEAKECGMDSDAVADEIVFALRCYVGCNYAGECLDHGTEFVSIVFEELERYGITMGSLDESNEFLAYMMNLRNAERMWANGGYSPSELYSMLPKAEKTTIVPGSSHMAQLLEESRSEIEQLGFSVDPDRNATEIPVMSYGKGINGGEFSSGVKKIYPNDPCPCGSGKKFKKCCGRNM